MTAQAVHPVFQKILDNIVPCVGATAYASASDVIEAAAFAPRTRLQTPNYRCSVCESAATLMLEDEHGGTAVCEAHLVEGLMA